MDEVRSGLQCVAAFGLRGDGRVGEPIVFSDHAWSLFLGRLVHQRLTGLAVAAAEAGAIELRGAQLAQLIDRQREAMTLSLTLERRLLGLVPALDANGIDYAVLKGPAVAHSRYPDPAWRPFGDLDILVRSRQLDRACELLSDLGLRRVFPEPRPGFVVRFGNTVLHRDDAGIEIDLHHTLVAGPFGQWIEPDQLLSDLATFHLGGKEIKRLGDTGLLLHACIHTSLGHRPPLLMPVRDIGQILQTASVDEVLLAEWVRRWELRGVLRHAFEQAWEVTATRPSPFIQALCDQPPIGRERWALEAYSTARRERGGRALATLRAISGIRRRVAFVRAMLFPDRRFLEWRVGRGPHPLLRRWKTPLSWLRMSWLRTERRPARAQKRLREEPRQKIDR